MDRQLNGKDLGRENRDGGKARLVADFHTAGLQTGQEEHRRVVHVRRRAQVEVVRNVPCCRVLVARREPAWQVGS